MKTELKSVVMVTVIVTCFLVLFFMPGREDRNTLQASPSERRVEVRIFDITHDGCEYLVFGGFATPSYPFQTASQLMHKPNCTNTFHQTQP